MGAVDLLSATNAAARANAGSLPTGVRLLRDRLAEPRGAFDLPHLVLLVDQFPEVLGGGERMVLQTARLKAEGGYRISIITLGIPGTCAALEAPPCPVYLLPMTTVFGAGALGSAWQLSRFLRRERVRIVQTYFESSNLFGGLVTRLLSRARLVWNRRDMGILRERKHWIAYRWLRWMPHLVMAVSEEVRRHAVDVDRIPPERVAVVYNGLPLGCFSVDPRTNRDPEHPVVVTVGNLRRVKGHDVLLEAAAAVVAAIPGARFIIAGQVLEPEFSAALQKRAAEPDLDGAIEFPGGVSDLPRLFRSADLFVLPSRSEGFSNAIVEAMAAGLPVVATRVGGNAEAVVDGVTGLLVEPESPATLAAALKTLLRNPETQRKMGTAGRRRVEEHFTDSAMLSRTVQLYDNLS